MKKFDVTAQYNLDVLPNQFGNGGGKLKATFTRTIEAEHLEDAVEDMVAICKEMGRDLVQVYEPILRT